MVAASAELPESAPMRSRRALTGRRERPDFPSPRTAGPPRTAPPRNPGGRQRHRTGAITVQPRVDSNRRRTRAAIALFGMAAAAVVGLANGLASCSPRSHPADAGRPVSTVEAQRLASLRLRDQQDGRSGVQATIGTPGAAVHLSGWIDWRRPLIYLASAGDRPGPSDGLVQAVPGLVAVRLGRPGGADDRYPRPPATPPTDGWRVRRLAPDGPAGSPFDSLFALLFALRADTPDDAAVVAT